ARRGSAASRQARSIAGSPRGRPRRSAAAFRATPRSQCVRSSAPTRSTLGRRAPASPRPSSAARARCSTSAEAPATPASRRAEERNYAAILTAFLMANETVDREQLDDAGVWTTTEDGERVPDYDATFPTINEGEVVHGTVVRVDKDEVLVDIGYKSEGVIPVAELSIRRSVNPEDEVQVGEEIDALVLTKEDAEGRLILSKKRARF